MLLPLVCEPGHKLAADDCLAVDAAGGECDCRPAEPRRDSRDANGLDAEEEEDEVGRTAGGGARRAKAASCGVARRKTKFVSRRSTEDDMLDL